MTFLQRLPAAVLSSIGAALWMRAVLAWFFAVGSVRPQAFVVAGVGFLVAGLGLQITLLGWRQRHANDKETA